MNESENSNRHPRQGRLGWVQAVASRPVSPLCETCQSLLVRPTCDPATQTNLSPAGCWVTIRLFFSEASRAAANGCVLCKLVMASQTVCVEHAQRESADPPEGFALSLWWSSESSQFYKIDMFPLNRQFTRNATCGIRLTHQGGSSKRFPEDSMKELTSAQTSTSAQSTTQVR